jgi:Protein of unknown function (DUF2009)
MHVQLFVLHKLICIHYIYTYTYILYNCLCSTTLSAASLYYRRLVACWTPFNYFLIWPFACNTGSGGTNYNEAGSCIDGRLTSAWHWCSKLDRKTYKYIFMLSGFSGFDGSFWKKSNNYLLIDTQCHQQQQQQHHQQRRIVNNNALEVLAVVLAMLACTSSTSVVAALVVVVVAAAVVVGSFVLSLNVVAAHFYM